MKICAVFNGWSLRFLTEAIVRVHAGVGHVPYPYGAINAPRKAEVTGGCDGQRQDGAGVGSECIDRLHVEGRRLLGRHSLLEVPQLQGLVLRGRDQHRLGGVEAQGSDTIEMAAQGVLGTPGFSECFFRCANLLLIGEIKKISLNYCG